MNSGIYTAVSGMKAQMDALDILSNNLANLNTAGYKEEKAFFTLLRQEMGDGDSQELDQVIDRRKVLALSSLNPANGSLALTNRDLDVALSGDGFLTIQTPQGVRYSRNGSLSLSSKSELTTADGFPILGESGHSISLGQGIIRFNEDGEVFLNNARVDRLKIVNFDKPSVLLREGSSLLSGQGAQEKPADAKVRQGYLEQSNVNPVSAVISMVGILRQFEATQKSVNLLMNDLNQKSIDRLGR